MPIVGAPYPQPTSTTLPPAASTAATSASSAIAAPISSVGSATRVKASVPCQCSAVRWCQPNPSPRQNASLNSPKPSPIDDIIVAQASTSAPPGPSWIAAATASGIVNVSVAGSYAR